MKTRERMVRDERLFVRLTAQEATWVADAAAERGLKISDFVRDALLRRVGMGVRLGRRTLSLDAADAVCRLSAINAILQRLRENAEAGAVFVRDAIDACLVEIHAALAGLKR